ncbi:MAG TPA: nitroreductase family deazaflavin-dependent oxidoreductase [Mycobacteriales bacterium]
MAEQQRTERAEFDAFNQRIIAEFRANGGKVGGQFEGMSLALLTTVGRKTGQRRTSPVAYMNVDGQPVVIASKGGAPTHPAWYHNLVANPQVTVEFGTDTFEATAEVLQGEKRDRIFAKVAAMAPGFGDYQAGTTRVIPVVAIHRAGI